MLDLTLLMGENFMLFSRVGLSSVVLVSLLAVSGFASADSFYDGYGYSRGVYIAPVAAAPSASSCGCHVGHYYHHRHHHHMSMAARHMYPKHRGFYVCMKYTYEATPIHRDVNCTQWKFKCMPAWHAFKD
jgi:hypothetical protein